LAAAGQLSIFVTDEGKGFPTDWKNGYAKTLSSFDLTPGFINLIPAHVRIVRQLP